MSANQPPTENHSSEVSVNGDVVRSAVHRRLSLHQQLPDDPKFRQKYPALWSWATFTEINDLQQKDRPNFSFRVAEGLWVIQISDASMAASLVVQAPTFEDALKTLDKLLMRPDAPWSPWRGKEAKLRAKKPKS